MKNQLLFIFVATSFYFCQSAPIKQDTPAETGSEKTINYPLPNPGEVERYLEQSKNYDGFVSYLHILPQDVAQKYATAVATSVVDKQQPVKRGGHEEEDEEMLNDVDDNNEDDQEPTTEQEPEQPMEVPEDTEDADETTAEEEQAEDDNGEQTAETDDDAQNEEPEDEDADEDDDDVAATESTTSTTPLPAVAPDAWFREQLSRKDADPVEILTRMLYYISSNKVPQEQMTKISDLLAKFEPKVLDALINKEQNPDNKAALQKAINIIRPAVKQQQQQQQPKLSIFQQNI